VGAVGQNVSYENRNYSDILIGTPIVILCFLAGKITAESVEVRRAAPSSASLRALCG
jgi:hypothetical protein